MRLRDRKALFAAILIFAGYAAAILAAAQFIVATALPAPTWPAFPSAARWMMFAALCLLIWRMLMRFACVTYTYDLREGMRSVPRMVVCNLIAIFAAWRAIIMFLRMSRSGRLVWDKTDHEPENDGGSGAP